MAILYLKEADLRDTRTKGTQQLQAGLTVQMLLFKTDLHELNQLLQEHSLPILLPQDRMLVHVAAVAHLLLAAVAAEVAHDLPELVEDSLN